MFVYALGVLQVNQSADSSISSFIKEQRLWYIFKNFEDAEKCVLENQSDIFEGYYNMALIEEVYLHDYSPAPSLSSNDGVWTRNQWWYQADYLSEYPERDPIITKIDKPKILENTTRFWVG